jgi:hypothetical protein
VNGGPVLHIGERLVAGGEISIARHWHHILFEEDALGLEAGRVDVRDVVRQHVHLPLQSDLPAERNELRIFHGALVPVFPGPSRVPTPAVPQLTEQKPCQSWKFNKISGLPVRVAQLPPANPALRQILPGKMCRGGVQR